MNLASFVDELEKIALQRSVQEWRAAQGRGDAAGANAIAQGHASLGNKPRYLEDISMGGAEAGVDKMMGHAGAPAAAAPNLQQRFQQYQQNKGQLGLAGARPSASVMQSPEARGVLTRGTGAPAQAPAPNESGLLARKLYKPDSDISRGAHTPALLEQKQRMTDEARGLSPEAKAMVPDMYGHQTMGSGPLQRTTSTHEYVPGISDLRGKNTGTDGRDLWSRGPQSRADLTKVQDNVLKPMAARGKTMADTVSATGTNFGNVVNSPQGPKVLDFLPSIKGEANPAHASFRQYAPSGSQFSEGGAQNNMQSLRKEVFNPKMQINEASGAAQNRAASILRGENPPPLQGSGASSQSLATARPGSASQNMPTARPGSAASAVSTPLPQSQHVPAMSGALGHAPTTPVASSAVHGPTFRPPAMSSAASAMHLPTAAPGLARAAGSVEQAAAKTVVPGMLRRAAGAASHLHI